MQDEFLRYNCQVLLPGFGRQGQAKLKQAKVLVVGAGGLGCPVAQYLAAAGIGTLGIADNDVISVSNLHRQVLYVPFEAGLQKAVVACNKLGLQNPQVTLVAHAVKITSLNVFEILGAYDIIADCTDNFETRYLLNDACVLLGKPLVYGAVYQYEGQVAVWNISNADGTRSPNYRDVFPQVDASQIPNCTEGGVIPTIAGIIGCMQANEVIKYLTNTGELLTGKILMFDALTLQSRTIKTAQVTKTNITAISETVEVPVITPGDLKKVIDNGVYTLVDIRNADERSAFNIGGAHIPLDEITVDIPLFNGSRPVVFYCASGKRSAEAVKKASELFPGRSFFSLEGGMKAWKEGEQLQ